MTSPNRWTNLNNQNYWNHSSRRHNNGHHSPFGEFFSFHFCRKLDKSGSGLIGHDDFLIAMTTRGEKLPGQIIYSLLTNPNYNTSEGKFEYEKYVKDVFETSSNLVNIATEKIKSEGINLAVNSKTYKVRFQDW